MRSARRLAKALGLTALLAITGGWANVNPSGDIQAYMPGGGGGNPNGPAVGNVDWGSFYQTSSTGPVTILAPNGVGLSVVGNANVTGALAANGNVTLAPGARLILNPNYTLYPSSIDFGTDASGGTTGVQAIVMGPGNPNSVPGPNSIQIGSGSQILGGGDRNVCVGAKCFIYNGLRSVAVGSNAACAADRCVALGFNAGSSAVGAGQFSVAIGNNSTSYGTSSISVGPTAACGTSGGGQTLATCVGANTVNPNSYSMALGQGATVTADHQVMLGTSAETVVHPGPSTLTGAVTASGGITSNGNITLAAINQLQWTGSTLTTQAVSSPGNLLRLYGGTNPGFILAGLTNTTGVTVQYGGQAAGLATAQFSGGALGSTSGAVVAQGGMFAGLYSFSGTQAALIDSSGNFNLGTGTSNFLQFNSTSKLLAPADGTLQVTKADGTFGTLTLGGTGSAGAGARLTTTNNTLTISGGDATTSATLVSLAGAAGNTTLSTSGQANLGEIQVTRTVGDAFRLTSTVHGRLSNDSQLGWSSGNAASVARDVSIYRSAAGVLGLNNGSGTSPNGSLTLDTLTANVVVPSAINPNSYYIAEEYDRTGSTLPYSGYGAAATNYNIATPNTVSAAIFDTGTLGGAYVATSSATQGGALVASASQNILKSTTITYRWRHRFYVGTLSDATNPYTLQVGSFVPLNATSAAFLPFCGPYLSYTHGTNSGQWVMGSAVNNTRTTSNSSVAVTAGWHNVTITLANAVYTFVLDGTSIGTVTDANMVTTPANGQGASIGGIEIVPDGASWTLARYAAIDRSDYYVTGLSR